MITSLPLVLKSHLVKIRCHRVKKRNLIDLKSSTQKPNNRKPHKKTNISIGLLPIKSSLEAVSMKNTNGLYVWLVQSKTLFIKNKFCYTIKGSPWVQDSDCCSLCVFCTATTPSGQSHSTHKTTGICWIRVELMCRLLCVLAR